MNIFSLKGKVAVVTGGSGVLGGAMAKGLLQAGAKVCIIGRTESKVEKQIAILSEFGEMMGITADVLDKTQLESSQYQILAEWGHIDILVNGAGGNMSGATIMPDQSFFDMPISDFDAVNRLNLTGTVLPTQVFGKTIAEGESGSIVNISSMAAKKPLTRVAGYAAAKAGLDNFTQWLSVELNKKHGPGIRVNAIAPGFFAAEQNWKFLYNEDGSLTDRGKIIIDHTPMNRFGNPEDLISTLIWLCADSSAFVTGTVIPVDGGFSAFSGV